VGVSDILDIVSSEPSLRSKRELIEKFVQQNMSKLAVGEPVNNAFEIYWEAERESAMDGLCADEGLERMQLDHLIQMFEFTGRTPEREDVVAALMVKPRILERRKIINRIIEKMTDIVLTFESDTGDL
jgi:type I restriction enzyme R subunit